MSPRYPLTPLINVREIARERAEIEVKRAAQALEQAEFHEAQVRGQLEAVREGIASAQRATLLEAERGPMMAHQFHLAEQRRVADALRVEGLSRELIRAQTIAEQKRLSYESAKQSAVRAGQELAAVERHRTRFSQSAEKVAESMAEQEAAENWLARSRSKPGAT